MLKKYYRILLMLALLLTSAYFLFGWYTSIRTISAWSLIPSNALMVYETKDARQVWEKVKAAPVGKVGEAFPFYQKLEQDVSFLDSMVAKYTESEKFFAAHPLLTSMHLSGADELEFLFYIDTKQQELSQLFEKIMLDVKQQPGFMVKERLFQGTLITEISDKLRNRTFSFIQIRNVVIAGFAPVLIEDIIRRSDSNVLLPFAEANAGLMKLPAEDADQGNVYINYAAFSALTKSIASQKTFMPAWFADGALLDVEVEEDRILLQGQSIEDREAQLLHIFQQQEPSSANVLKMVPAQTAILYHWSFSDKSRFFQSLAAFRKQSQEPYWDQAHTFFQQYQLVPASFYQWMEQEIALCVLESANASQPDKLVLVPTTDPALATAELGKVSLAAGTGNRGYTETLGPFIISSIEVNNFPALLLGNAFDGFDQCFYTVTDSTVIMANSLPALRTYLAELESAHKAGRAFKNAVWAEKAYTQANVSLMVHTARAWNILWQHTHPAWRKLLKEHEQALRKIEVFKAQCTFKEGKFLTTAALQLQKPKPATPLTHNLLVKTNAAVAHTITSRPFIVKNGEDRSTEMVFQDEAHVLYLLNKEGKVMFKHPVGSALAGDVEQVELNKDGRLQYFFATQHKIYLLDNYGAIVSNYPVKMPDTIGIKHASVIDYDKSKNYRFLVTNKEGDMYMFDQRGQNLEGWTPRRLGYKPATAPFHLRIRDKDCIVSLQQNGMLHLLRRNGEEYPGFPLQLHGRFESKFFVEQGLGFEDTYLTIISKEGLLYSINLKGEVIKKVQAYRPGPEAVFSLCPDAAGRSFIVARQYQDKVSLLDPKFNLLFEKAFVTTAAMPVQYYNFGAGNEIIAITDKQQGQTYIFDKRGKMQPFKTIKSSHEIGLIYSESADLYFLYRSHGKEAGVVTFRWN